MLKKDITEVEYRDTGLALLLICFLLWFIFDLMWIMYVCLGVLLLVMIVPKSMKYPAMLWLGLSSLLGKVVSKLLLGFVYSIMVIPVGLIRQLIGKDAMRLKSLKNGKDSVFVERRTVYESKDLNNPF